MIESGKGSEMGDDRESAAAEAAGRVEDLAFSYVGNWNPVDGVWCRSCRASFRVELVVDAYGDGYVEEWGGDYGEAVPVFCPFCGAGLDCGTGHGGAGEAVR